MLPGGASCGASAGGGPSGPLSSPPPPLVAPAVARRAATRRATAGPTAGAPARPAARRSAAAPVVPDPRGERERVTTAGRRTHHGGEHERGRARQAKTIHGTTICASTKAEGAGVSILHA